jgi:hypothetical protein
VHPLGEASSTLAPPYKKCVKFDERYNVQFNDKKLTFSIKSFARFISPLIAAQLRGVSPL